MDWGFEGSTRRRTCMLMVTHACNLNCSYCYEPYKKNVYMRLDLAKEIISREAQFVRKSDQFDEIEIDFMGGEPLMNFPLIRDIVEWLETSVIEVPWICFATTNGTLLTPEIKSWLRKHKDTINLGASYDGNSKMQFINRGTEKYNIDLAFFKELWPHQPLHMTISKETLPTLAKGVLDIQNKGYKVEAALAEGVDWMTEDALMYREQLCILKDAYLKNTALTPLNRLSRFVSVSNLPVAEKVQRRWCGTGKYMATYDIDGKKYGCHMFTPLVCGDKALLADAVEWDSPELTVDDYCKSCVLRSFCPTCLGFNYKRRGHIAVRDKCWCLMILAEAITACEFQVELIADMEKLNEKDAQHGQAALEAYQMLRHLDIATSRSPYSI